MPIVAILFDADGVIQRPTPERRGLWTTLLGGTDAAVELFLRDVFALERLCYYGERDFMAALPELSARWNCTGSLEDAMHAWTAIEADEEILQLITAVRASGIWCHLATNQEPYRGRYMAETLGYRTVFDRQFYSYEVGLSKPDPTYFTTILKALNTPAERVLFLDDVEANGRAAESVGIRAELLVQLAGATPIEAVRRCLARHGIQISVGT